MKIVGWMPLKKQSTRLPGKNWRNLAGKPLFWHMLETMSLACPNGVYINTDYDEIAADYLIGNAPRCVVLSRKVEHREPTLSPVQMLVDDLDIMQADVVVYTHATIPLLEPDTLSAAIDCFVHNYPRYDSVISVSRMHERFFDSVGRPMNFHPGVVLPLQDMPPVYLENSAFFIMHSDDLRRLHRRIGDRPYMYEIPDDEAVEIDDGQDFRYAEWLYTQNRDPSNQEEYNQVTDKTIFDHILQSGRIYD